MQAEQPVVMVTGGSGLLGSRLIQRLRGDYRVVSLDREGDPLAAADVEFICVDLTSDESVRRAIDRVRSLYGNDVAALVHLAAFYDFSGRPSPLYEKVTVQGTARLLDAVQTLELSQFVFSSTMLVHRSSPPGHRIAEDDPVEAGWAYPESKLRTEKVIAERRGHIPAVVLRIAGVYDEDGHSPPIANQVKRIHGRWVTSHFYPADPNRGQAFVHRDDVIDAILAVVDRRHKLPDDATILIGEPETIGYGELQDLIAHELHGKPWRTQQIPKALSRLGAWVREKNPLGPEPFIRPWMVDWADDHYELDISRARELLDWEPRHSLRATLPEMLRRVKADPPAWYAANKLNPPRRA